MTIVEAEGGPCTHPGCTKPARMAVRTTRPTREDLRSMIHFDDRAAPKTAQRYCKQHGTAVIAELIKALVSEDA